MSRYLANCDDLKYNSYEATMGTIYVAEFRSTVCFSILNKLLPSSWCLGN